MEDDNLIRIVPSFTCYTARCYDLSGVILYPSPYFAFHGNRRHRLLSDGAARAPSLRSASRYMISFQQPFVLGDWIV